MAACLTVAGLGACAQPEPATDTRPVLRIAAASGVTTLNPVLNGTGIPNEFFLDPVYAPLIEHNPDGSFGPGLATSWQYLDDDNKTFQLKLRQGARFADGEAVTAQIVKDWFTFFQTLPGSAFGSTFDIISSIDVSGEDTLTLNLSESNPLMPMYLSQNKFGYVIGPKGMADPDSLGTTPDGAGPYTLDPGTTTVGSIYTFLPNEHYWDQDRIHWSKIVVTVMNDPNSVLSALQSGQVDFAVGQPRTADAARSAGLTVTTVPFVWNAIVLWDRGGEVVEALGDVRVRQALNYAIDREAIEQAVFGEYATANVSMVTPDAASYSQAAETRYGYDPAKAKALLEEAGYGSGFTLPVVVWNRNGTDEMTFSQAVAGYLADIGVTLDLIDAGTGSTLANDILALKYAAFSLFGQTEEANLLTSDHLMPNSGIMNPFGTNDPQLIELYNQVQAAPEPEQAGKLQALQQYIVDNAFYLQAGISDNVYLTAPAVTPPQVSANQPIPNIVDLMPAG
jgi:peptide/nickel transport system substrate-binding protein